MSASQNSTSTTGAISNSNSHATSLNAKKNNETTLTHLTKRFVKLLNTNSDRVVNLNEASSRLSVAKRRIYDITNVLEGIGLLQKTSKNVTRWIDCPRDSPYAAPQANQQLASSNLSSTSSAPTTPTILTNSSSLDQLCESSINSNSCSTTTNHNLSINTPHHHSSQLQHHHHQLNNVNKTLPGVTAAAPPLIADPELLALLKTYQSLEEGVQDLEANIRQQLGAEGAYVTYHDIKSFFNDQIVIAVKAPPDTRLEVNESLQIWMKSENGEIEVYLCPQYANTNNQNSNQNNHACANNNSNLPNQLQQQQQHLHHHHQNHVYHHSTINNNNNNNNSPHLQQSHIGNSQPLDNTNTTITNNNNTANLILQQQQQPSYTTAISSDEGRGKSMSTTDGQYYDPTSGGVSNEDHYYNNDPTLSSALSGNMSEDDDPFKPLVPFEAREDTQYNFTLGDDYSITELFPEDNLGLY